MSRRRAFEVVDLFEEAIAEFTGAPYAVAVDSCTNALFLSLLWARPGWPDEPLLLPKNTYVGVRQVAVNAGWQVEWTSEKWQGSYFLDPTDIVDSAKRFYRGMYEPGTLTCLSFQAGKLLPIGRGGAILTDDVEAVRWLKAARLDGRTEGADYQDNTYQRTGFHCYMDPPSAARGLWLLTYIEDDDQADWTEYPDLSVATWA